MTLCIDLKSTSIKHFHYNSVYFKFEDKIWIFWRVIFAKCFITWSMVQKRWILTHQLLSLSIMNILPLWIPSALDFLSFMNVWVVHNRDWFLVSNWYSTNMWNLHIDVGFSGSYYIWIRDRHKKDGVQFTVGTVGWVNA